MELEIRPYVVGDAPSLQEAIVSSIEHLRPWMAWAALEPKTLEERIEWIEASPAALGIFVDDLVVGGTGIHDRIGPTGREIGYWVRADRTNQGIATEAARRMTERILAIPGVDHVEIHHDKANVASGRVPEKLGYVLVREMPDEISAPGECGISREWRYPPPADH